MGDRAAGRSAAVLVLALAASARAQDTPPTEAPADQAQAEPATSESPPAEAPSEQEIEARAVVARADALFQAENFSAALAEFERAYELVHGRPNGYLLLYNVGLCYERLFRYDRALEYYRRYLEEGGEAADGRAEVLGTIRALEGLLGTVRVRASVPGASVWIDEHEVGTAPGDIQVPGGRHTIELRAAEHLPLRREFQVAARGTVDLDLTLEPIPEPSRGISPAFFFASTGVTIAALVAGVALGSVAISLRQAADARSADPRLSFLNTAETNREIGDFALAADLAFGGAALFAATAVVLYFLTDWGGEQAAVRATARGARLEVRW